MKFVTIKIPVTVEHDVPYTELDKRDPRVEPGTLEVRLTMHDTATTKDALVCLAQKLDDRLHLVDLGDEE